MFKNFSIRNQLLVSNLIMVLVPVALVVVLMLGIIDGFSYFLHGNTGITQSIGVLALYQLQQQNGQVEQTINETVLSIDLEALEEEYLSRGEYDQQHQLDSYRSEEGVRKVRSGMHTILSETALRHLDTLEDWGSYVAILVNDELVYLTANSNLNDFRMKYQEITGDAQFATDDMIVTNNTGTILAISYPISPDKVVSQIVVAPQINNVLILSSEGLSDNLLAYADQLFWILLLVAFGVVVIFDILLAASFSRGILSPLNRLRRATNEVREGNLDHEIGYESKNEIGQLCADFETMRIRLRDSIEKQHRYEENRKELVAGISHDMGTPLTSIKGYAQGVLDGIANTPEKQQRYMETIISTVDDMDRLLNQFQLFSKLDMDEMPFYYENIPIETFTSNVLQEYSLMIEENGIEFEYVDKVDKPKSFIKIDKAQTHRVLNNIFENCVKYQRTDVEKKLARLTCGINADNWFYLRLESNGKEVSPEECELIFKNFYRSNNARTSAVNGSGLGLTVCKRIVERHGGIIFAQPSDLGGLAVEMKIPVIEEPENLEEKEEQAEQ